MNRNELKVICRKLFGQDFRGKWEKNVDFKKPFLERSLSLIQIH